MAGLDWNTNEKNLTAATWCDHYPCLEIGGVTIAEPTTAITDWILFVELWVVSLLLLRPSIARLGGVSANLWGSGWLMLGVSFLLGGASHGFAIPLKCEGRDVCINSSWVWVACLLTQTLGFSLGLIGTSFLVLTSKCWQYVLTAYSVISTAAYVLLVLFGALVVSDWGKFALSFKAVLIFAVPSVVIIFVLFSIAVCCSGAAQPGSCAALVGWIVSIVGMGWQATGIGVNKWFNHNDIFHVILMVGSAITGFGLNQWFSSQRREDYGKIVDSSDMSTKILEAKPPAKEEPPAKDYCCGCSRRT